MSELRATGPGDATLLAALHLNAYRSAHADWDEDFFRRILELPTTCGLTCDRGFILWQQTPDFGEIITLAVMAAAQGQGLGRGLLQAYEAALGEAGVSQSVLDVAEDNVAARALYAGCGYSEINRRAGYYQQYRAGREARVDALVMQKLLQP